MKKLLLLLTLFSTFAFTACDLDEATDDSYNEVYYGGTLTVIPLSGGTSNTWEGSRVSLLEERDGTLTLWLFSTRFVPQMPPMDMAVPFITYAATPDLTSLLGDQIVPYVGGTPYPQFMVTNLSGTISGNQLNISFNCMGHRATFIGNKSI